jgi:xylulokinase
MSLLGIDVGTTGCKAAVFSTTGDPLASAYREYDVRHPRPGWDELDADAVWRHIKSAIAEATAQCAGDPVQALSVSSLGEAIVPVAADRTICGPSLLLSDARGAEYLPALAAAMPAARLYAINGNTLGNHFSLTKLIWLRERLPAAYARSGRFLLWSGFVAFMLGAEAATDYSLANRTLLFDLDAADWSPELTDWAGIAREKLPRCVPAGTMIGQVIPSVAAQIGVQAGVPIVAGAHDQCANAVGCGVIGEGSAVFGMGTFICITPVFSQRRDPQAMMARGLNTEHHAVANRYVTFLFNQGGSLVKWFRNTFAHAEHQQAQAVGRDVYTDLFAELPDVPSSIVVLPHFSATGPPAFITDTRGVIAGLRLETARGDILKGILEGTAFYLKQCVDDLPATGIAISDFRAVGGGSKSDAWVQLCADIFGRPFIRPQTTEAGALGAAMIAGVGAGCFTTYAEAVQAMVRLDRTFDPDLRKTAIYVERCQDYSRLYPLLSGYLREISSH